MGRLIFILQLCNHSLQSHLFIFCYSFHDIGCGLLFNLIQQLFFLIAINSPLTVLLFFKPIYYLNLLLF
ncbi:hypothetical protein BDF14DRAFT_1868154 [Spinellus fusiger]|nr:hypothetical protein BDF14DRAFT_1868154 [Spinellus fusiger]